MIPEFQKDGNLPKGLYEATLHEVRDVFGTGSARRKLLIKNFENIVELAKSTGKLERVIVWGSFVSKKIISPGYRLAPNNLNVARNLVNS